MRWQISGLEPETGKRRAAVVEAATRDDAIGMGLEAGLSQIKATEYKEEKIGGLIGSMLPVALVLIGITIACVAAFPFICNAVRDWRATVNPKKPAAPIRSSPPAAANASTTQPVQSAARTESTNFLSELHKWLPKGPAVNSAKSANNQSTIANSKEASPASDIAPFVQLTRDLKEAMVNEARKYQASIRIRDVVAIFNAENLFDPQKRSELRQKITLLRKNVRDYDQAATAVINRYSNRLETMTLAADIKGPLIKKAEQGRIQAIEFIRAYLAVETDGIDEIEGLLDLMDRAQDDCSLVRGHLLFHEPRETEDFRRMASRMQRLANLEVDTSREYLRNLKQQLDTGLAALDPQAPAPRRLAAWTNSRTTGAHVRLDAESITINGKRINLNVTPEQLFNILGKPSRQTGEPARFTWDDLGIGAWQSADATQIGGLIIAINPRNTPNWPNQSIHGDLKLLGINVDENATPPSLNRKLKSGKFETAQNDGRH